MIPRPGADVSRVRLDLASLSGSPGIAKRAVSTPEESASKAAPIEKIPGISLAELQDVVNSCVATEDFTVLVRFVGKNFSNLHCIEESFMTESDIPKFDLDSTPNEAALGSRLLSAATVAGPDMPPLIDPAAEGTVADATAPLSLRAPSPHVAGSDMMDVEATVEQPSGDASDEEDHAVAGAGDKATGGAATPLSPFLSLPPCDLDVPAVISAFTLVQSIAVDHPNVHSAWIHALNTLSSSLNRAAPKAQLNASACPLLRAFMVFSLTPLLEDPATHAALLDFCRGYDKLKPYHQQLLGHWFASAGGGHKLMVQADDPMTVALAGHGEMLSPASKLKSGTLNSLAEIPMLAIKRNIDWCQQYITVKLYRGPTAVDDSKLAREHLCVSSLGNR
jgi:hypothetical protein